MNVSIVFPLIQLILVPTNLTKYLSVQVIKAPNTSSKDVLSLKSRCLEPGKYALHINRWLMYYRY